MLHPPESLTDFNFEEFPHHPLAINIKNQTNSMAFNLQANYTNGATATGWGILVPTFGDEYTDFKWPH
jgi:hypothetical protein